MMSPYTIACEYVAAGLSVIPLRVDGSKAPAVSTWNEYRLRFPTDPELRRCFVQPVGMGVVCGVRSGGVEALDFDKHADETFAAWADLLPPGLFSRLTVVETGGLGYHVIYRCSRVCGNCKIAMTAEGSVLIESRGEGGYIVAAGTAGATHASGNPYVQVRGVPLPELPVITPDERVTLWQAAAALDRRPDPMEEYVKHRRSELQPPIETDETTPWADFNTRADWMDILQPHGWKTATGIAWTRPGKEFGTSAKIVKARDGTDALTVFSANAGALAAIGTGHRTWGKFSAFAALNYGGDRSAAAKAAIGLGYGRASK